MLEVNDRLTVDLHAREGEVQMICLGISETRLKPTQRFVVMIVRWMDWLGLLLCALTLSLCRSGVALDLIWFVSCRVVPTGRG